MLAGLLLVLATLAGLLLVLALLALALLVLALVLLVLALAARPLVARLLAALAAALELAVVGRRHGRTAAAIDLLAATALAATDREASLLEDDVHEEHGEDRRPERDSEVHPERLETVAVEDVVDKADC